LELLKISEVGQNLKFNLFEIIINLLKIFTHADKHLSLSQRLFKVSSLFVNLGKVKNIPLWTSEAGVWSVGLINISNKYDRKIGQFLSESADKFYNQGSVNTSFNSSSRLRTFSFDNRLTSEIRGVILCLPAFPGTVLLTEDSTKTEISQCSLATFTDPCTVVCKHG
jgi:hypothetical protein